MELRHLATFQTVASLRSFTRAAHTLGYSQASVTAHIQALEAELGAPLFDRLGRQTILTEVGIRFAGYAERLLQLAEEARAVVAPGDEPQGTLVFSAPESVCAYRLPALLQLARAQLPRVRLVFRPAAGSEIQRLVRAGDLDLAFVMAAPLAGAALSVALGVAEPVVLLARPDHPLAGRARIVPADLADQPLLLTEPGCAYRVRFDQQLASLGKAPREQLEFSSVEAIKQCAVAGMGLAVLPAIAVERECAAGLLVALPWAGASLDVVTQLIYHPGRWHAPALTAFVDLARGVLAPEQAA